MSLSLAMPFFLKGHALAAEEQWIVLLDHAGFGRCNAIFSQSKIRFDDGVLRRLILPPYDYSIMFNVENRKVMKAANETFAQTNLVNFANAGVKKMGTGKLFGLNCTRYQIDFPSHDVGEYWATKEIRMDPKLAVLCSQMGASPPGYGVPLRMQLKRRSGKTEKIYEVVKLERTTLKDTDFAPPRGFSKARDLFELHFCDQQSDYSDAVDDAFMTPLGERNKQGQKK